MRAAGCGPFPFDAWELALAPACSAPPKMRSLAAWYRASRSFKLPGASGVDVPEGNPGVDDVEDEGDGLLRMRSVG